LLLGRKTDQRKEKKERSKRKTASRWSAGEERRGERSGGNQLKQEPHLGCGETYKKRFIENGL
jgi:hypothetical protein